MKFSLIFIFILLVGCKDYTIEKQDNINSCRDMGGIPVLSIWDGRLSDCIFKDNNKGQDI